MASARGHIEIDKARCKGCSFCIDFCPRGCIRLSEELNLKGYFVATFVNGASSADARARGNGDGDFGDKGDRGADTGNSTAGSEAEPCCNGCGMCALMCPEVAIEVVRS